MTVSLLLCAVLAHSPPCPETSRREASLPIYCNPHHFALDGDTLYFPQLGKVAALDWKTFRYRWRLSLPKGYEDAQITADERHLFITCRGPRIDGADQGDAIDSRQKSIFLVVDKSTQKQLWTAFDLTGNHVHAVVEGKVYVSFGDKTLSRLDPDTGTPIWTSTVGENRRLEHPEFWGSSGPNLVLFNRRQDCIILDDRTGKRIWSTRDEGISEPSQARTLNGRLLVVDAERRVLSLDLRSRKPKWERKDAQLVGTLNSPYRVLVQANDSLYCLNADSGAELWNSPMRSFRSSEPESRITHGATTVVWKRSELSIFEGGLPVFGYAEMQKVVATSPDQTLTFSDGILKRYCRELRSPIPQDTAGRVVMAEKLVKEFELLDEYERADLAKLGSASVSPILNRLSEWQSAWNNSRTVFGAGNTIRNAYRTLFDAMQPSDTERLLPLVFQSDPVPAADTLSTLFAKGDPQVMIPFAEKLLRKELSRQDNATVAFNLSLAASYLLNRADPKHLPMVEAALESPEIAPDKVEFIGNLVGKFGERAYKSYDRLVGGAPEPISILGMLNVPRSRIGDEGASVLPFTIVDGQRWSVLRPSSIVASTLPMFVLVKASPETMSLRAPQWDDYVFVKSPATPQGEKLIQMIRSRDELSKDSDADGLQDSLENIFGTNPKQADSDSDGVLDGTDHWPTVARKPESLAEKIVEAAWRVDALSRWNRGSCELMIPPPFDASTEAFELLGRPGYCLPVSADTHNPRYVGYDRSKDPPDRLSQQVILEELRPSEPSWPERCINPGPREGQWVIRLTDPTRLRVRDYVIEVALDGTCRVARLRLPQESSPNDPFWSKLQLPEDRSN